MMAGDLGLDLTVISDYHGAKDPDELIQKDPTLWQQAVEHRVPAVDWLLAKYEESLDLRLAPDKRKYSDIALKLLGYVRDEVERASYEEKVATRLGVAVEILRDKGDRLNKKLEQSTSHKYYKKPKTSIPPNDTLRKLENSLLALKIYGGITKTNIPLDIPSDDTKLSELELVFNREHEAISQPDLEKEATELLARYNSELRRQRIAELSAKLEALDEDDDEYDRIITEINRVQHDNGIIA